MNIQKIELKEHKNYKKTTRENNASRAQAQTILFVKTLFGYKIIPENQHITFSWENFIEYAQELASILVPFYFPALATKYKKDIAPVIKETSAIEAFNLMAQFKNNNFKLPTKCWNNEDKVKFDVFVECHKRVALLYILQQYNFIKFSDNDLKQIESYFFLSSKKSVKKILISKNKIKVSVIQQFVDDIDEVVATRVNDIYSNKKDLLFDKQKLIFDLKHLFKQDIRKGVIIF